VQLLKLVLSFLAGLGTAVLLAALLNIGEVEAIQYGVVSERTIVVQVVSAPGVRCGITDVDESPQQVRIVAMCYRPFFFSAPLSGVPRWFVVKLQDPLAGRSVIDGSRSPAAECSDPLCGASAT
jgi:hypothetical protein